MQRVNACRVGGLKFIIRLSVNVKHGQFACMAIAEKHAHLRGVVRRLRDMIVHFVIKAPKLAHL